MSPELSAHAAAVAGLLSRALVEMAFAFGVAFVVLIVLLVRAMRRDEADAGPGDTRGSRLATMGLAAGLFLAMDVPLLLRSDALMRRGAWDFGIPRADPRTVRVEVTARQWGWEFRLAGRDGAFATSDDVVTVDEWRVPLGVPVHVQATSVDVVHGFSMPQLRQKVDVIPGRRVQLWFRADAAATLEVACAQHCGTGHGRMSAVLTVTDPDAWQAWLGHAEDIAAAGAAPAAGGWPWTELP